MTSAATGASVEFSGEAITISANSEERAKAVKDVFGSKLVKRGISLKSFESSDPKVFGKEYRIEGSIKEGIDQPTAKKISSRSVMRGPSPSRPLSGDELRVSSKSRDDLQSVIAMLKDFDDADLQFVNMR